MSSTASVAPTTGSSSQVDVSVPLRAEYGSILRLVTASLGADAGFTVDDIDDLRLALSEVFASIVDSLGGGESTDGEHRLAVTFDTSGQGVAVTLSPIIAHGEAPSGDAVFQLDELATSIIQVAVDEFEVVGTTARLVKFGGEQTDDQRDR
jgi:hypothetical protein